MCMHVGLCVWVRVCVFYVRVLIPFLSVCSAACCSVSDLFGEIRTHCRRSGPDSDLCPLWTRYTGDLKTDL